MGREASAGSRLRHRRRRAGCTEPLRAWCQAPGTVGNAGSIAGTGRVGGAAGTAERLLHRDHRGPGEPNIRPVPAATGRGPMRPPAATAWQSCDRHIQPRVRHMLPNILLFAAIGFAAQMVDGAIGMAYGITATSVMVSSGIPPAMASASVHAAEVATTGVSGFAHWRYGNLRWRLVLRLAVPGMVGGVLGACLLVAMPVRIHPANGEHLPTDIGCGHPAEGASATPRRRPDGEGRHRAWGDGRFSGCHRWRRLGPTSPRP